jgi:DDE family transposase
MVEPETAGNPMNAEKGVRSSLQHLSENLKEPGHAVGPKTVGRLLKDLNYSLKANVKRRAGSQHPDRNTQFEYMEAQKQLFLRQGWPLVSLDGKQKELIGNFKNAGQSGCLEAEVVNDHDFETESQGRAAPYGIYDVNHNRGYVYVGQSADTAEFAVDILSGWWQQFGQVEFPNAPGRLALCDCGGSNGYRSRLWKAQLQEKLADPLGMTVIVGHDPTGTSKWNPIEHRLFGPISINWAAKPLRTIETMLAGIRGTTTKTGLQVSAFLHDQVYPRGIQVADEVMESLRWTRHATCPNWNYTIQPRHALAVTKIGC